MSIILGLDPGSRVTGFGVLKTTAEGIAPLSFGIIRLDTEQSFAGRMVELAAGVQEILAKYQPEAVAVEKIFLGRNADSAFKLGHARGVLICEAAKSGAVVFEYATRVVKKSLTGKGSGGKEEVQAMVQRLLGIRQTIELDASDALALALHHAHQVSQRQNWLNKSFEVEL